MQSFVAQDAWGFSFCMSLVWWQAGRETMGDLISPFIFIFFLVEQKLFWSVHDESGMKGKSSGAEDLTSTPAQSRSVRRR